MKRAVWALLALTLALAPAPRAFAQSPDKVISRYTKAQGKKAVERVATTLVEGTVESGGRAGRFTLRYAAPDRLVREVEVAGAASAEGYNGKSAWLRDPGGVRTLVDHEARSARLHAILSNARFQRLSRYRVSARALGATVVGGRPASAVEFALEGARERVFFDDETGMPVKRERTVDGGVEEAFYGDYRRVGGVLEPFSIRIVAGGRETRLTVERVAHNLPVDERAFHVPSSGGDRPLPELAPLLEAVRANQEKVRETQERYAFREIRTERREGGRGGTTRVFRVVPVAGRFVRELISVDGKELSPAEREKERERAAEQIRKALEEAEKRKARAAETAARGEAEEDGDITISTFLRACEISSVRRERLRDRELLAFDFEPRDDFEPKGLGENVVSKLAGTVWVDESALQVVRLEARLTKKVKVGGGLLASLAPDSLVVIEQARINEEVWLPSFEEVRLSGKVLVFKKIELDVLSRFDSYERYDVESDYAEGAATKGDDGAKP